jgi:GNAT superfamily N-acetyltransferase
LAADRGEKRSTGVIGSGCDGGDQGAGICRGNLDTTWAADVGGQPVGFVVVIVDRAACSAEIEMLAVDPGHQRQGIASALMKFALERMREAGVRVVAGRPVGIPDMRRLGLLVWTVEGPGTSDRNCGHWGRSGLWGPV